MSSSSSSARASRSPSRGEAEGGDKGARILAAAQDLFARYGVRRTSMDDVAREAGIAKGTLYLYHPSKDALFAAVAQRLCDEGLAAARRALAGEGDLAARLAAALDVRLGEMRRLVMRSPHAAELLESKESLAAATFEASDREYEALLRSALTAEGVEDPAAVDMLLAAAHGLGKVLHGAEKTYRKRLAAMVEVILAGLPKV